MRPHRPIGKFVVRVRCVSVVLSALLISSYGCASDDDHVATSESAVVASPDLLGNGGATFFPLGVYMEGLPRYGNWKNYRWLGGGPFEGADSIKYYEEVVQSVRGMGLNWLFRSNAGQIH